MWIIELDETLAKFLEVIEFERSLSSLGSSYRVWEVVIEFGIIELEVIELEVIEFGALSSLGLIEFGTYRVWDLSS